MEQQGTEQYELEDLHNIIGAHEVAEGVVPSAPVLTQDAEVGACM